MAALVCSLEMAVLMLATEAGSRPCVGESLFDKMELMV